MEDRHFEYKDDIADIFNIPGEVIDLGTDEQGVSRAKAVVKCSYDQPGTHFAAVRVKSNVDGSADDVFISLRGQVPNDEFRHLEPVPEADLLDICWTLGVIMWLVQSRLDFTGAGFLNFPKEKR